MDLDLDTREEVHRAWLEEHVVDRAAELRAHRPLAVGGAEDQAHGSLNVLDAVDQANAPLGIHSERVREASAGERRVDIRCH